MTVLRRLRYWLDRARREEDLRLEIEQHIEEAAGGLRGEGLAPAAARAEAIRRFGRPALAQEDARAVWIARIWQDLWRDARHAARHIARNPGFAAAAILSAALGIAACTTVFGMVNFALFQPLPAQEPARLMSLSATGGKDDSPGRSLSYGEVLDLRHRTRAWESVAAYAPFQPAGIGGGGDGEARRHWGFFVSGDYFDVVKPAFAAGGGFTAREDDVPGAPGKIVLSHALWQSRFNGDTSIVGRAILVNKQPVTVTGVTGPGFRGTEAALAADFFLPLSMIGAVKTGSGESLGLDGYRSQWLYAVGRLRPAIDLRQARAELVLLARGIATREAGRENRSFHAEPAGQLSAGIRRYALPAFLMLLAVTLLVLLTACANVANLTLARASARGQEIATRLAIGAGRGRLVRQLLTESLLLALAGGALGLLLSEAAARYMGGFPFPAPVPLDLAMHTDYRVALFAAALAVATGVAFGLIPALRATRPDLFSAIKWNQGVSPRRFSARNTLVVAQVAMSAILVICSGLFLRSLGAARGIAIGMDPSNILLVRFDPALGRHTETSARRLIEDVLRDTGALPGVRSASVVNMLPLSMGGTMNRVGAAADRGTLSAIMVVAPRYFETMGIHRIAGSDLRASSGGEAVVNEELARRLYPDGGALGRPVHDGERAFRIAGIVGNSKYRMVQEEETMPILYEPLLPARGAEGSLGGLVLVVKTNGAPPATLALTLRRTLLARDAQLVVNDAGTMEAHLTESLFLPRLAAALFGLCGGMGLLIASIGIYGVISFTVARRSREIGIRMALGALPSQVLRSVLWQGTGLSLVGILFGLAGGLVLARLARALLVGVSTTDPVTFLVAPLVLLLVALMASAVPARRAAAIDPNRTLRAE